ncbi:P44/Msp2 family outer membrane protein, partial [Anaplasma phagocytophilum]|uniref:P44/Msp2 family outer membrane protein n=1 Tax=Anaplasma phagocytophilum TaxID=948 RepID=UPI0012DADC7B
RVELEIGYERFKTKGIRDSGSKEDEADTVYLLAKELAYDVVNHQEKRLATALAGYKGEDIVRFANAVKISAPNIDKQVCKTKADNSAKGKHAEYAKASETKDSSRKTSICGDTNTHNVGNNNTEEYLSHFAKKTLEEPKNWPTSTGKREAAKEPEANDNADAVAGDLIKLTHDEKTKVAGLLARTIEGGEVVEIRAVSSTSVMVNACYDLLSEGLGVVPYACVGLGGNFVGVVDGHITLGYEVYCKTSVLFSENKYNPLPIS